MKEFALADGFRTIHATECREFVEIFEHLLHEVVDALSVEVCPSSDEAFIRNVSPPVRIILGHE